MMTLAKILIPVDFSGRCLGAARYAEVLAARFGSEITLLHVVPYPHYEFSALEVGGSIFSEVFATRVAKVKQELACYLSDELADFKVQRVVLEGDPARKIVEYAHTQNVDLVIMPTHGYGPFRRFILGSVTAKVLHDAECPVWTGVHMEEIPKAESVVLNNTLVAVDLGEQSMKTLTWGAWLAAAFGSHLSVVYAVPCLEGRGGDYFDADWRLYLVRQAEKEIAELQAQAGTQAEVIIQGGDAPMAVCSVASRIGANLLVIGRGSAAGVFGRLRTNAYAIIRQSPCPVVSV
jgi:nucleotide-binding universal stress UspA family protein